MVHLPAGEQGAVNPLLFVGFVLTIAWTFVYTFFGNPDITLPWSGEVRSLGDLQWIVGINLYLAILWHTLFKAYRDWVYKWISSCYVFAIYEMFIVWDKPWFTFLSIPITSNTLIFFGFAYAYIRNIRARYW